MSNPTVFLTGLPGAGKGTQARLLASKYDVRHLDVGQYLRENEDRETPYGTPREYMEQGELVPDELINELVGDAVAQTDGIVVDGYPRTPDQVRYLVRATNFDLVVWLSVNAEELERRLTGRRIDPETGITYHVEDDPPESARVSERLERREEDRPEIVEERIAANRRLLKPVKTACRDRPRFEMIDGNGAPESIANDIIRSIERTSIG